MCDSFSILQIEHAGILPTPDNETEKCLGDVVIAPRFIKHQCNHLGGKFDSVIMVVHWFFYYCYSRVITPPRNRGRVIFPLQFVCVSVCVTVRLSCEQNFSRTDEPI